MSRRVDRRSFLQASIGFGLTVLSSGASFAALPESQQRSARFQVMLNGYVASGVLGGVAGSLGYGVEPATFLAPPTGASAGTSHPIPTWM